MRQLVSVKCAQLVHACYLATLLSLFAMYSPLAFAQDDKSATSTINKLGKSDVAPIVLSGAVVDADGKAVADAIVHFDCDYAEIDATQAVDKDGLFKIELRMARDAVANIAISANSADGTMIGYYNWSYSDIEPRVDNLTITIQPPRMAKIKVVDGNDAPITGANVALQLGYSALEAFTTDDNGIVHIAVPESSKINAALAWKDGAGLDYRTYQLPRNNANIGAKAPEFPYADMEVLKLEGASPLTVHVVDDHGAPLANAETYVWMLYRGGQEQLNLSYFTKFIKRSTDESGVVVFDWFPLWQKDKTVVWPTLKGYTHTRGEYDPVVQRGNVEVKLECQIPIRGQLTFADGKPAPGVVVVASGAGYTMDRFHGSATTDESGRYEILASPNQIYMLWIQDKKWGAPAQSGFPVISNQDVPDHNFQLSPAIRVYGQLLDESTNDPIADKYINLTNYGVDLDAMGKDILTNPDNSRRHVQPIQQHTTKSNAQGEFEFFVGPGEYNVFTPEAGVEKFTLVDETEKRVDLHMKVEPTIQMDGSIVDYATNEAVAAVKITGVPKNLRNHNDWAAFTDAEGKFKVKRSAEPTVLHAISSDKHSGAIAEISDEAKSVEMRLKPLGSATGRLMTEDGSAPAVNQELVFGVHITDSVSHMSTNRFGGLITVDAEGKFTMENLVPGWEYQCVIRNHPTGYVLTVANVKVEPAQKLELGDLRTPKAPEPYREPTLDERIQEAFSVAGTAAERYDKAVKLVQMVNQNLIVLFGDPKDARVRALMNIRYNDDSFGLYSEDFRFLAIPTDGDRLTAAKELAKRFSVDLSDGREAFHLLVINHNGELVASSGVKQLCEGDQLSKDSLIALLESHRTQPLDAQTLLDNALKQAAQENKHVIVQETATWCGPCHKLSRFLTANRQWEQDYIWIKMDHRWTGSTEVMEKLRGDADGGIPWCVILDSSGNKLATSNIPETGENIGFPSEERGQVHFANMLKSTRQRMTDADIDAMIAATKTQQ